MLSAAELTTEGWRLVRFGVVGTLAAIVYAATTFLIVATGLAGPVAATIVGHIAAGLTSYFGHLHYSFAVEPNHRAFLWRFVAVAIVAFASNIVVTWLLTAVLQLSYIYSIIFVTILIPLINYVCNRFWIFKSALEALAARGGGAPTASGK